VLVVREHAGADPMPIEQSSCVPGVLAEDYVGLAELTKDAEGDVFQVPDRRRADCEHYATES